MRVLPLDNPTLIHQILISEGLCPFSHSLSAASIRVCHPAPVDLNASMTSGEYLIVVDFLMGMDDNGLPGLITLLPSFKLAFSKNASSSSGASSESTQVLFKSFNFAFISFPHRDNATCMLALCPDHNNKSGVQFAYCNLSDFSLVLPIVLAGKVHSSENLTGSGKINTTLQQRFISLILVIFNLHTIIVVTLIGKSKADSLNSGWCSRYAPAKSGIGLHSSGGGITSQLQDVATMATAPTPLHSQFFTISVQEARHA